VSELCSEIVIENNAKFLNVIYQSLLPETTTEIHNTKVSLKLNKKLKFVIECQELSALRATLNSYLRWLKNIIDITNL